MEEGSSSPKRLKSSPDDGRPVRVGRDNVSQRLEQDGSVQNDNGVNKVNGQNGVESNQATETTEEANMSTKLNANESPASIAKNSLPLVNLTGYVEEAPRENDPVCVVSAPTGLTSSYISTLDERQLKREKRKQANRESARKSRLRKQAEYEELVTRWDSLKEENEALQSELTQLNADSDKVRRENAELMEKLENSGVAQKGEISSSNAGADSIQTSNASEKVLKSESLTRKVLTDHNMHESSNSETKLHQLLEPGSRSDTSIAA